MKKLQTSISAPGIDGVEHRTGNAAGRFVTSGLSGWLIVAIMILSVTGELTGLTWPGIAAGIVLIAFVAVSFRVARRSERVFIAVAGAFFVGTILLRPDWPLALVGPLTGTAFIAAFFSALTTLRSAASTSPVIERCGRFFAHQPAGRRYAALTVGGHLFSLMLSYGAFSLLGTMVERMTRDEPDEEIRRIRLRRMLLAIQRGLIAILCWSPIALPMAIATTAIDGADWHDVAMAGFAGAVMLMATGWLLDTLLKPRRIGTGSPAAAVADDLTWSVTRPLFLLLGLVFLLIFSASMLLDLRAAAAVILVIPILSAAWVAVQSGQGEVLRSVRARTDRLIREEIPSFRPEIIILTMAGAIGSLAALLLGPMLEDWVGNGLHLPPLVLLLTLVWLPPLLGQLGMNPILSVTLLASILPPASKLGLTPGLLVLALCFGWALCGASSPFAATTLLLSRLGNVSVWRVGLVWNGPFAVSGGIVLSLWLAAIYLFGLT